jgi:hypothetical protein
MPLVTLRLAEAERENAHVFHPYLDISVSPWGWECGLFERYNLSGAITLRMPKACRLFIIGTAPTGSAY